MWQRNDTGHVQDVAAFPTDEYPDWRPFTVGPGEVIEFPDLLAGFAETDAPSADAEPQENATTAKTTRRRAAQASADSEGDETQ